MPILHVVTADDWPLWRDARLAALADAPHAFKSRLADWADGGERRWRSRFEMPGAYNVLALREGRPVGVASGVPGDNGVSDLRSVWVSPDLRGRGVGDQLVSAVERWARRAGATTLRLTVIPGNEPAIALYRRNGFALTGERGSPLPDGTGWEQVMRKSLA